VESADRRQRPWRATITGFDLDPAARPGTPAARGASAVLAATLALQQRLLRDYLSHRDELPAAWRGADLASNYTLRLSPAELTRLGEQVDALIRPFIAPLRDSAPADAELVNLDLFAFPRTEPAWNAAER
jgi:hypothetical protein